MHILTSSPATGSGSDAEHVRLERGEIRSGRGAGPFFVRRPTLHGVVFAILCLPPPEHPDVPC